MVTKNVSYETDFGLSYSNEEEALESEFSTNVKLTNDFTKDNIVTVFNNYADSVTKGIIGGERTLKTIADIIVDTELMTDLKTLIHDYEQRMAELETDYNSVMESKENDVLKSLSEDEQVFDPTDPDFSLRNEETYGFYK